MLKIKFLLKLPIQSFISDIYLQILQFICSWTETPTQQYNMSQDLHWFWHKSSAIFLTAADSRFKEPSVYVHSKTKT